MTDRDSLLLQKILDDMRTDVREMRAEWRAEVGELRAEVAALHQTVAEVRGGWKAVSFLSSLVGAGAGGLAAWFGKGAQP